MSMVKSENNQAPVIFAVEVTIGIPNTVVYQGCYCPRAFSHLPRTPYLDL